MSLASVVAARIRALFDQNRHERELDEEVRFHLEMQIEDNLKAGMSPEEAHYAAMRSFGGVEPMKETYRERRAFTMFENLAQDIRFALRTLRKSPGYTVTAVLVLALAIGANTAMFSVLNAVLLRPLPFRSPEQLAMLWREMPSQGIREGRSGLLSVEQWRSQSRTFADLAFFDPLSATLTTASGAEQIRVVRISSNLFGLLGVQPAVGRVFTEEEARERQRLALISHAFWLSRFAGSGEAIGSTIEVDGAPSRIVGIIPAGFEFLGNDTDVFEPYTLSPNWESVRARRGTGTWFVVGRLQPNISIEQAQAEMTAIAQRLDEQSAASDRNYGVSVVPLDMQYAGSRPRIALWLLACAVFAVLLIACTNVASLSLARSASREREISTRLALGASHWRIIRQLITESLTLTVLAGGLGLFIAHAAVRVIVAFRPGNLARLDEAGLDGTVLAGAMAMCLLTGVAVGLAPVMTLLRKSRSRTGTEGGRGIAGGVAMRKTRRALVVTELALASVLLAGAGLLMRSLSQVEGIDPGFRPERILVLAVSTPAAFAGAQRSEFHNGVLEQLGALPGVESVSIISDLFTGGNPEAVVTTEGGLSGATHRLRLRSDEASEGFFQTVGTPLLRGRFFDRRDGAGSQKIAIINEAMARRLWPGDDPVGRRYRIGEGPWFTVVGVVGDMRRQGLEIEPIPQVFEPLAQNPPRLLTVLVRTASNDPLRIVGAARSAVWTVDKDAPVYGAATIEERLEGFVTPRRFQTILIAGFAAMALLMAAVGIYGLIRYAVATRTHEIGIRVAVGARSGQVLRMFIREGLMLSVSGLLLGLAGALAVGRVGSSLLFGVTGADPLTFGATSMLLLAVALAACYFPARAAMKLDPISALRHE